MKERKEQHIKLVSLAQMEEKQRNPFFNYEPLFGVHPPKDKVIGEEMTFLGQTMKAPLWISSMTGGAKESRTINRNLAQACGEFSLGMGLGSCRPLLKDDEYFEDFNLRPIIGDKAPFYANLGVAQLEELIREKALDRIVQIVDRLRACGLIIHVNPLQEWFQPEGDRFLRPPIETIQEVLEETPLKIIVKEVGQGMGPKSLKALMELPLEAIELAGLGGTNFSKLESMREKREGPYKSEELVFVGHSVDEMIVHINTILRNKKTQCRSFIISGGINNALRGLELMSCCLGQSVFAMAHALLNMAQGDYQTLRAFVQGLLEELAMAQAFLDVSGKKFQDTK